MLEFSTTFNTRRQPEPERDADAVKYTILLTGPFAGDAPTPFTDPVVADVDSFATIMGRTAPATTVAGEHMCFRRPTDFDPLMVAQAHAATSRWFAWLSAVRTGGPGCPAAREAGMALGADPSQPAEQPAAPVPPAEGPGVGHASFEDLLSGSAKVSPEPTRLPANSIVDRLISQTISGSTVPAPATADALLDRIAEKLGQHLRAVYRDPAFRELETVWMTLDEMIGDFDTDDPVRFLFLPFSRADWSLLMEDSEEAGRLRARVAEVCPARPNLVVTTEFASPLPDKAGILAALAALATACGCPVIANADLRDLLRQAPNGPVTKADLLDQSPFPGPAQAVAHPRVRLATPRFRMRLPYGEEWNPAGSFVFEEFLPGDPVSSLPWAPASLLCARAWASKYREDEADTNWNEVTQMAGFPPITSGAAVLPATEFVLTEAAMAHLYHLGCLPLTAMRNSDRILVGA